MQNGKVLIICYEPIGDNTVRWWIDYQDEKILRRDLFWDTELNVRSVSLPEFRPGGYNGGRLYIRGSDEWEDYKERELDKEYLPLLLEKVRLINEKYGISCTYKWED